MSGSYCRFVWRRRRAEGEGEGSGGVPRTSSGAARFTHVLASPFTLPLTRALVFVPRLQVGMLRQDYPRDAFGLRGPGGHLRGFCPSHAPTRFGLDRESRAAWFSRGSRRRPPRETPWMCWASSKVKDRDCWRLLSGVKHYRGPCAGLDPGPPVTI